jgi:hypothetical protein
MGISFDLKQVVSFEDLLMYKLIQQEVDNILFVVGFHRRGNYEFYKYFSNSVRNPL